MTKKTAIAIRHVHFEDLGAFARPLEASGYEVAYIDAAGNGLAAVDALAPDLVVILGGPIGVCEIEAYPILRAELALLSARLAANRPILGVCLGAQLIARALGARVFPAAAKEIGWAPIDLTAAGRVSPLRRLGAGQAVLHWHGDTFDLPAGAARLASTAICENQAFALGPNVLALQFHLEARGENFEHWLIGHAAEIAATPGIEAATLREDARRHASATADTGRVCLNDWLQGLEA